MENERRQRLLKEYTESPEYKEKIVTRLKIQDGCLRSQEARIYAIAACKSDPIFFINNFCWTPNDKYAQYHFPFILYPFQEEMVEWINKHIDDGRDGLVEKSREMGVTWLFMTVFVWRWLFSENFNGLIGSYKQEKVDDRTKDSLFGMIDYQLKSLPKWMLPKRFSFKAHRFSMKLANPENNNLIKGDTMNPEFSRGSRRSVIFLDEGAYWEYFQDAWDASADTANCRITVSTPQGYNAFAALRNSGQIDIKTLIWNLHPLKDEKWYEYEKSRRTDENIAQELDISYQRSPKGRVYPEWDLVEYGEFPYDPSLTLYVSWDFGMSDDTAMIWWQRDRDTNKMRIVDCYWNNGKTIDFYVPLITGVMPSNGYVYSKRDLELIESHKNWSRGTHFGDPAGRFRNQVVNTTVLDVLKNNGIFVNFKDQWKEFEIRIPAAKMIMKEGLLINKTNRTGHLNICMINSQYAEIQRGGMSIINSTKMKPRHDANSHLRSAFEYGALGLQDFGGRQTRVFDKFKPKQGTRAIPY